MFFRKPKNRGFSLVELIVVVVIIGILSGVAYLGIQKVQQKAKNERMLDDLIAVANAMETYKQDHFGEYPNILDDLNDPNRRNQNILCFDKNALYVHDCNSNDTIFVQGFIDNALLGKRYLPEVPTDPWTGSRYVYGMSSDMQFYQVAGLWLGDNGKFEARTQDNLFKGFPLPSIIRAFDGPNFVVQRGEYLPYNPDVKTLVATARNVTGTVTRDNGTPVVSGDLLTEAMTIMTGNPGSVDLYFSDGSVTSLEPDTTLTLESLQVAENDGENIITKITGFLSSGKIWSKVVRLSAQSEFKIKTTNAIAGVRGTEFGVIASPEKVLVKSGEVEITHPNVLFPLSLIPDLAQDQWVVGDISEPGVTVDWADNINPDRLDFEREHYSAFRLNNDILPHLLSVTNGVITVENLYTTLGFTPGTPQVPVTDLFVLYEGAAEPLPVTLNLADHNLGQNYTVDLPTTLQPLGVGVTDYENVRLQFAELSTPGDLSSELLSASAWSSPSLEITPTTTLEEEEVNPAREARPSVSVPEELTLVFDPTVGSVEGAAPLTVRDYDFTSEGDLSVTAALTASTNMSTCDLAAAAGAITGTTASLGFTAVLTDPSLRGSCELLLTFANPAGDVIDSDELEIRVLPLAEEGSDVTGETPSFTSITASTVEDDLMFTFAVDLVDHTGLRVEILSAGATLATPAFPVGADTEEVTLGPITVAIPVGMPRGTTVLFTFNLVYTPFGEPVGTEETIVTTRDLPVGMPTITRLDYINPLTNLVIAPPTVTAGDSIPLTVQVTETNEGVLPGTTNVSFSCAWAPLGAVTWAVDTLTVDIGTPPGAVTLECDLPTSLLLAGRTYAVVPAEDPVELEMVIEAPAVVLDAIRCSGTDGGGRERYWVDPGLGTTQSGCWLRAASLESCTAACDTLDDAGVGLEVSCSNDTYAVPGDPGWNDNQDPAALPNPGTACDLCGLLTSVAGGGPAIDEASAGPPLGCSFTGLLDVSSAPYSVAGATPYCRYRDPAAAASQTCGAVPTAATRRRICRCE